MKHDDRVTRALVKIMIFQTVQIHVMGFERVQVTEAGDVYLFFSSQNSLATDPHRQTQTFSLPTAAEKKCIILRAFRELIV